ncbi:2'-5' RNA ligase family protein [Methanoregula sp.]|uniref:2'-5' RNA ligase family protein n=1 Tax=Methanoregula sp. TaxID=2052170 RepID=UPI003BB098FA
MLIEIRIGPGKWKIKDWISHFKDKCQIPDNKIHRVPHISLYGSFSANSVQVEKIKSVLATVGRNYSFLPFTIDGLQTIEAEKGIVVYFNIVPSERLKQFRRELAANLFSIVPDTKPYDFDKDFLFHSTLSYKLFESEYGRILTYINSLGPSIDDSVAPYFYLPMAALRITLLNDKARIICEYDLLQHRLLSRLESLSKRHWQKTSKLFRIKKGMEKYHESSDSIYLIGDLHFSHANIIRYAARPFLVSDVDEMNTILVENWNNVIDDTNVVYFLGDLDFKDSIGHWIRNLNGKKIFIEGNHDVVKDRGGRITRHKIHGAIHHDGISYKGHIFYLVHNPREVDLDWRRNNPEGWLIHGHTHDNEIHKYPFINGEKRTINVSAEVTNYRPVSLDYILSLDLDSIERMDTIDSIPQKKVSSRRGT